MNNQNKQNLFSQFKRVLMVLLGSILLYAGICFLLTPILLSNPTPKYGKEFNPEREKRGIPTIPENWDYINSADTVVWHDPEDYWKPDNRWGDSSTPDPPVYYQKHTSIQDENTIKETDIYFGSDVYKVEGENWIPERIMITCVYHLDIIENMNCTADVQTKEATFKNGDIEKAREILEEWRLSYP